MERPLVLMSLELALLRHHLRPGQRPLDPLLLNLKPGTSLGRRTFPKTIRGSITNPRLSTSSGSSPTASRNAAVMAGIPYGVAGVLGAVVAAIFV